MTLFTCVERLTIVVIVRWLAGGRSIRLGWRPVAVSPAAVSLSALSAAAAEEEGVGGRDGHAHGHEGEDADTARHGDLQTRFFGSVYH